MLKLWRNDIWYAISLFLKWYWYDIWSKKLCWRRSSGYFYLLFKKKFFLLIFQIQMMMCQLVTRRPCYMVDVVCYFWWSSYFSSCVRFVWLMLTLPIVWPRQDGYVESKGKCWDFAETHFFITPVMLQWTRSSSKGQWLHSGLHETNCRIIKFPPKFKKKIAKGC
jgi:hypothetical protein